MDFCELIATPGVAVSHALRTLALTQRMHALKTKATTTTGAEEKEEEKVTHLPTCLFF
jgi:hypothetical protein